MQSVFWFLLSLVIAYVLWWFEVFQKVALPVAAWWKREGEKLIKYQQLTETQMGDLEEQGIDQALDDFVGGGRYS